MTDPCRPRKSPRSHPARPKLQSPFWRRQRYLSNLRLTLWVYARIRRQCGTDSLGLSPVRPPLQGIQVLSLVPTSSLLNHFPHSMHLKCGGVAREVSQSWNRTWTILVTGGSGTARPSCLICVESPTALSLPGFLPLNKSDARGMALPVDVRSRDSMAVSVGRSESQTDRRQ